MLFFLKLAGSQIPLDAQLSDEFFLRPGFVSFLQQKTDKIMVLASFVDQGFIIPSKRHILVEWRHCKDDKTFFLPALVQP